MEPITTIGAVAGVIALLLVQFGAVLGSVAVYLRMRTKLDGEKSDREANRAACHDMGIRIDALARQIVEQAEKSEKRHTDVERRAFAAKKDAASLLEMEERIESLEGKYNRLRASKAASARYSRRAEVPEAEEVPEEVQEQQDLVEQSEENDAPLTDSLGRPRL